MRGGFAREVAVARAVQQVGVARAGGALGLKVIHRHYKAFTGQGIFKDLCKRRAVQGVDEAGVHCSGEQLVSSHRGDRGGFVDDGLLNRVGADRAGGDIGESALAGRRVQARDQVRYRVVGISDRSIVFNFHDAGHVRVNHEQRGQNLVALAGQFFRRIRAAAFHIAERAANERAGINGREVIEDVEAGYGQVARQDIRGGRAEVHRLVIRARGGLNAVFAEVIVHHADDVRQLIAAAEEVLQRERQAVRMPRGVGVGYFAAVVEQDAVEGHIRVPGGKASGVRLVRRGKLHEALGAQNDLAKLVKVVVFHNAQFLRDGNVHAFELLEVQQAGGRQAEFGRLNGIACGAHQNPGHG